MYLCNEGHNEVCYDSRDCPACEYIKKFSDAEDVIYELKEKIEELNAEKGEEGK